MGYVRRFWHKLRDFLETGGWVWLEQLRQDLRFSARALLKSPGFSITVIVTVAFGAGANTAIFTLIDALMLKPLPVSHPEQLMQVNMAGRDIWGIQEPYVSNPVWEQIRDRQDVFSGLFGYAVAQFDLSARGEARYVQGNYVSGQFFDALGLHALLGRAIRPADDRWGCLGIAVLGYGFWRNEFGGRTDVIGATITLDSHPFEIAGVIGPGFTGVDVGRKSDIYVPLCAEKIIGGENGLLDGRRGGWLRVIGRPKPGLKIHQVNARLKTLAGPIMEATMPPNTRSDQRELYLKRVFDVQRAPNGLSNIRAKYSRALTILMAIAGGVLVIACTNIANMLLARGAARHREIAICMALGSARGRLIRRLLSENLLLSLAGAAIGLAFAQCGARMLAGLLVSNVYRENRVFLDVSIDFRLLAFTLSIAAVTGLLFGLVPAWRATRVDPQSAMKANGRGVMPGGRFSPGKALVVIQVALSLVLVACAGLLLTTFIRLDTIDPGFEPAHVLLMDVDLGQQAPPPAQRGAVFSELLDHLRTLPDVRSVSASAYTPLGGAVVISYVQTEGSAGGSKEAVFKNEIGGGYFETLGVPLLAGRDFSSLDTPTSPAVAIVNESFAKSYFHNQNPIGRRYREEQGNRWSNPVEIVGLVRDAKYLNLREDFRPTVYVAVTQKASLGRAITVELRVTGNATAIIHPAARVAEAVSPDASLQFKTLAEQVDGSLARERLLAVLSCFFGGLALLLALIGLYGLTAYNVNRRRKEIGIRMALGAQRSRVMRMVLGEVTTLIAVGLVLGLAATSVASHFLVSLLYGVKANDSRTLCGSAAILALVAGMAGFVPARRASRADPMNSLRE